MTRCNCGRRLWLQVLSSGAGYYLGFRCPNCGPWSRETWYMETREKAEQLLKSYFETCYW